MHQRYRISRSDASPKRGVCWCRLSWGTELNPQTLTKEWSLCPKNWKLVVLRLSPSSTRKKPSPLDPIHLPIPSEGETPEKSPSFPVMPFMVPTLVTLVSTAIVWTYGSLTIPAQDVVERGQWCIVQALMWDIPQGMPSPYPFPGHSAFVQMESQSTDIGPSSLFLKRVGSASPGPRVQYSPISGGSKPVVPGI